MDRRVAVVGDRIVLSSLRHPSLNITFTMNRWAHFILMLEDIDDAARLRPLQRKAVGRRRVSFRSHLGEGYYVTAIYCKRVLDFRLHFVVCGSKINMIYASSSGITINLQEEWNDLFNHVIPAIHEHYSKFANIRPRCGYIDSDEHQLGWKACTVCYPFGQDSDLEDND